MQMGTVSVGARKDLNTPLYTEAPAALVVSSCGQDSAPLSPREGPVRHREGQGLVFSTTHTERASCLRGCRLRSAGSLAEPPPGRGPRAAVASAPPQGAGRYRPLGSIASAGQTAEFSGEMTGSSGVLQKVRLEYLLMLPGFQAEMPSGLRLLST